METTPGLPTPRPFLREHALQGPLLVDGVFYFMAAAALLLTFLAAGRSLTTASPQRRERPFEILAPQAAPLAHDQLGSSDDPLSPAPVGVASEKG